MALITPEEIIVLLDLPADAEPYDRAQLVCDLVVDAVTDAAGGTLATPYPAGVKAVALGAASRLYDNPTALRGSTVDDVALTYGGDVQAVLTEAERAQLRRIFGKGGSRPLYSFPEWDWSWTAAKTSTGNS